MFNYELIHTVLYFKLYNLLFLLGTGFNFLTKSFSCLEKFCIYTHSVASMTSGETAVTELIQLPLNELLI